MDGFLDTYMEDSSGHVERFSFDKFLLDEERSWRGPYLLSEEDSDG